MQMTGFPLFIPPFGYHMNLPSVPHQASCVGVDSVGRVDELRATLGVLGKFLAVVEPAVLWGRETLVLQAAQLRGGADCDRHWHTAPWYDWFHCTEIGSLLWSTET